LENVVEKYNDRPDGYSDNRCVEDVNINFLDCDAKEKYCNGELDKHHIGDVGDSGKGLILHMVSMRLVQSI